MIVEQMTQQKQGRSVHSKLKARTRARAYKSIDKEIEKEEHLIEEKQILVKEQRYAGFWLRFWAFLFDLIVLYAINQVLLKPVIQMAGLESLHIITFSAGSILYAISFFAYFALMTKYTGQSLGKMIIGIKVISIDGKPLSWGTVLFREGVGRLIHQIFFFTKFIYIVIAFTPKKQGIHDMIAQTAVIHVEK
ncbi:RDD family protein [Alkalihalobacillus trypoxylicola]|uniref:RDD family protein n=1 Tax=Alkalihalobacillus trypoxylicola TaxID=519424 RepID=UPI000A5F2C0D|nr:RDD family protein [Alkalihalobacillus trypoxylicola]